MFPLIPALILLLLQGHLPNERGAVAANLDALPWNTVARSLGGNSEFGRKLSAEARAWLWLLSRSAEADSPPEPLVAASACAFAEPEVRVVIVTGRSDRTRDGPVYFA